MTQENANQEYQYMTRRISVISVFSVEVLVVSCTK